MPLSVHTILLSNTPSYNRTIRIRQSDITTEDILNCNNPENGIIPRTLKIVFKFDYIWMGAPFTKGLPSDNFVEAWREGKAYYAAYSDKFTKFLTQIEKNDLVINTLTEHLEFYQDFNAIALY